MYTYTNPYASNVNHLMGQNWQNDINNRMSGQIRGNRSISRYDSQRLPEMTGGQFRMDAGVGQSYRNDLNERMGQQVANGGGQDTGGDSSRGNFFSRHPSMTSSSGPASIVGSAGSAIANAMPGADGEFSVDKNAGFKGSFSGLSSGGVVGAIAGGVGAQLGEMNRVKKALGNVQTNIEGYSEDVNGNPIFNSQQYSQGMNTVSELNKGEKSMKLGAGLDPATAAFAWATGTKKKLQRKRDQLKAGVAKAASDFNTADVAKRTQNNQMEDYYQRMNKRDRLYNVYKSQY